MWALLSLAIAALILVGAVRLILEITDILMESVPGHLVVAEVASGMAAAAAATLNSCDVERSHIPPRSSARSASTPNRASA